MRARILITLCFSVFLTVPVTAHAAPKRPDLQSTGATVPRVATSGAKLSVRAAVSNAGRARARGSRTGFYLSTDARRGAGDARLARVGTKALNRGKKTVVTATPVIPALLTGTFRLIACADDTRKVRERVERNNCKASRGMVEITPPVLAPSPASPVSPLPAPTATATPQPGANGAPVVTSTANDPVFTEGDAPVVVDPLLTIADADDSEMVYGTVALASPQTGEALILVDDPNDGIAVSGSGTSTIALTGSASLTAYRDALRAVRYGSSSDHLADGSRSVSFTVNDGNASGSFTRSVQVVAVSDPPIVSSSSLGSAKYWEGELPVAVDPDVTVADDGGTLTEATISIVSPQPGDRLTWWDPIPGDGVTLGAGSTATTLVLTGSGSLTAYSEALRTVEFDNTTNDPGSVTRQVKFVVRDAGGLESDPYIRGVEVTPTNEAPVVNTGGGATAWTEGGGAVAIAPGLTVSDSDSSIGYATVTLTNPESLDSLWWTDDHPEIFASGNGSTAMTFYGPASAADFQQALRSVQFDSFSDNPSGTARTVSFSVTDTDGTSSADADSSRKTVSVTPTSDYPVVNTGGGTTAWTEGQAAVAIAPGLTVSGTDSSIVNATVTIVNSDAGDRLLWTDDHFQIDAAGNGTDSITFFGTATPAAYEQVLRSVRFDSTSADPSETARTVSFTVTDTHGTPSPETDSSSKTVSVTAVP